MIDEEQTLPDRTLVKLAFADDYEDPPIRFSLFVGQGKSRRDAKAMTQGAGRGIDPRNFRVTEDSQHRRLVAPIAPFFCRDDAEISQHRIKRNRGMAFADDDPIVEFRLVLRILAHVFAVIKGDHEIGHGKGRTRMALLHQREFFEEIPSKPVEPYPGRMPHFSLADSSSQRIIE